MQPTGSDIELRQRWQSMRGVLDERQRRLFAAAEAKALGRGGIARVARATGLARGTIVAGLHELAAAPCIALSPGGTRRPGAGRKAECLKDPTLTADLHRLLRMAEGKSATSLRVLERDLGRLGHRVGRSAIARLLATEAPTIVTLSKAIAGKASAMRVRPTASIKPAAADSAYRVIDRHHALANASAPRDRAAGRTGGGTPRDIVMSLANGLAVIGAFDHHRAHLTIAEVAVRCQVSRATARRYLLTLEHLGYAEWYHGMYALTPKVIRLGQSFTYSSRLPQIITPELLALATTLQEASSAGVLDGDDVISIAATTGVRNVSATLQSGTRVPAYCTSNGRVILGALGPDVVESWIARQQLRPLTRYTITSARRLSDAIARARVDGYALVDQEFEIGLRTVAVPLFDHRNDVVASLNIGASASRTTMRELVDRFLPELQAAQARLRPLL